MARIISKANSGWGSHVNDLQNDSKLPYFLPSPIENGLRRLRKSKETHFKTVQL